MAMTTLCPQCKAVCTIPESALGVQVACSRCQAIFTAQQYAGPAKLRTKPPGRRALRALAVFLLLLAVSGTVAMMVASFVFLAAQLEKSKHPHETVRAAANNGGGGVGFGLPLELEEDKNPDTRKPDFSALTLLSAPAKFAVPQANNSDVNLAWRPGVVDYSFTVHTWVKAQEQSPDGSLAQIRSRTIAEIAEMVQAVDENRQASIRLRLRGYQADASRDGSSRTMPLATATDLAPAAAYVLLNEKGDPTANRIDVTRVPAGSDGPIKKVVEAQRALFEFCAIPMPNLSLAKPGTEWSYERPVTLQFSDEEASPQFFEATAKLLGSQRGRSGEYAVVELRGKFKSSGKVEDLEGKGWALIEAATGTVMEAQAEIPFAISHVVDQTTRQVKGAFYLSMHRQVPQDVEENN